MVGSLVGAELSGLAAVPLFDCLTNVYCRHHLTHPWAAPTLKHLPPPQAHPAPKYPERKAVLR